MDAAFKNRPNVRHVEAMLADVGEGVRFRRCNAHAFSGKHRATASATVARGGVSATVAGVPPKRTRRSDGRFNTIEPEEFRFL